MADSCNGKCFRKIFKARKNNFWSEKKLKYFWNLKIQMPSFVLNYKQAEMIKMAINLYLLTSVSYANLLDFYCRQYGFKFLLLINL